MRQREMRRMWSDRTAGQDHRSERLEIRGATDARQQDAVLGEAFRRPEPERDGRGPRVPKPLLQIREAQAVQLVFTAERHVCRDESTLHGIHEAPDRLEAGAAGGRYEEAELGPDPHAGEGEWDALVVGPTCAAAAPVRMTCGGRPRFTRSI